MLRHDNLLKDWVSPNSVANCQLPTAALPSRSDIALPKI